MTLNTVLETILSRLVETNFAEILSLSGITTERVNKNQYATDLSISPLTVYEPMAGTGEQVTVDILSLDGVYKRLSC